MSNILQTKTAEEILSTVFKPKEFIIDGLLTQGLYVLAGAQKVGKSWLAMDICLSIATGVPVLGRETIQGTALYLCLEDNYQRLQRRLFQMNAEPIENLHFAVAADKIGAGLEEQIEAFKKDHDDLKIVVIDVMQMVRSNVESSYGADYAELIALKQVAYRLGICILLIHHMRKAKDDNPFNMMTGSTGIGGATDGNFALKETKCGSGKAIMYCQGRDIEYTELRMHFDTDVMRWIVENEPATQKSRDNIVLSAVYLFIRERIHFEGTATELVEELKSVTDEVIYPNRVTRDLVQNGYELSKYGIEFRYERVHNPKTILRVMNKYRLLSVVRRRKYCNYSQALHRYDNLLNRDFHADRPNQKWVTDISYIKTAQGFLYLSVIRDLYDRSIVAYKTSTVQNINLVLNTIKAAKRKEKVTGELQLHSDQGFQYTSQPYFNLTKAYHITPSMSRRGNPYDNALAENFFSILKTECIYRTKIKTFAEARHLIDDYIYFYNNQRIQLKTKLTPLELRSQFVA